MLYLDEIKALNLPPGRYTIYGSGPLAIRGLRKNGDIDIIVKKDVWDDLVKKYPYFPEKECVLAGHLEIRRRSKYINNIGKVIATADIIKGFAFANLKEVLEYKKTMGRKKDLEDIKLINKYLKSKND